MSESKEGVNNSVECLIGHALSKIRECANQSASRIIEERDKTASILSRYEHIGETLTARADSIDAEFKEIEWRIRCINAGLDGAKDAIGKVVRLKSGGLTMTASALGDDGGILCVWSSAGGVYQQSIPLAALEIVEPSMHGSRENIGCSDADALARLNDQAAAASMKFSPLLRRGAFGEKDAS